jgi:hypothetical protein
MESVPKTVSISTKPHDLITRPKHYIEGRKHEPVRVIYDWQLSYNLGTTVKYISRAGRKTDKLGDLKKALQYLTWEIEILEGKWDAEP